MACQIDLIFRGGFGVAVHFPERLGQPQPGGVEIAVAVERRAVMVLERLGVVDFHPAVILRQPQERARIGRGVADPAADDLLGLAQPVGHQVKPGECLVDGRVGRGVRFIQPHENRLCLGEPADSRQCDRVQPLELAFGQAQRLGLVELIGDFPQVAFFERDLGEQGVRRSRARLGSKPLL